MMVAMNEDTPSEPLDEDVQRNASPAAHAFTMNTIKVLKRHGYSGEALVARAQELLRYVGITPSVETLRQLAGQ
jgi:hypothetical protein